MYNLKGKTAIVTGGSQGIGFGICEELAKGGAKIYIVDVAKETSEKAVEALRTEGYTVDYAIIDIVNTKAMEQFFNHVAKTDGHIDILVNNAGVNLRKFSFDYTEKDWDFIINVNLKATFFNSVNCAKIMKEQKWGRIINTCSIAAFNVRPVRSIYGISKAGVLQLTKYLALEYASMGITVNGIAPGLVQTPLNAKYFEEHPNEAKAALNTIPVGRSANPHDIGSAVRFLASDESRHITGHTIVIDGGTILH